MNQSRKSMKTIGSRLMIERKNRGYSIEQVSDNIKIRPKYISALEAGNYDMFPSDVYIKGFLRNYSSFLGFDPEQAVRLYRRERAEQLKDTLNEAPRPIREPRFVITPVNVIVALVIVLLSALFGYVYYQYQQFASPPFLDIVAPKSGDTIKDDVVTIEGSTESDSLVTINDQSIKINVDGSFKVTVSLRPGSNKVKIASENGIGKKSEEVLDIFSDVPGLVISSNDTTKENTDTSPDNTEPKEDNTPSGEGKDKPVQYDGLEMEIAISPNSAWLLVETDNETAFAGVLVSDSIKTFKATEKIYIKTGNAGSTKININGQIQEPLGGEGDVESREYTLNMFSSLAQ